MIDRALNATQSYFFYLYPQKLIYLSQEPLHSTPTSVFKFSVYKGLQKVEDNKTPTPINFNQNELHFENNVRLAFNLSPYVTGRKIQFSAKLYYVDDAERQNVQIACLNIDPNKFIKSFKDSKTTHFNETLPISEDYQLQYDVFVERSKILIDRLVKDIKADAKVQTTSQNGNTQPVTQRTSVKGVDELSQKSRGSKILEETPQRVSLSKQPKEDQEEDNKEILIQKQEQQPIPEVTPTNAKKVPIKFTQSIVREDKVNNSEKNKSSPKPSSLLRKKSEKQQVQSVKIPQNNIKKLRRSREAELKGSRSMKEAESTKKKEQTTATQEKSISWLLKVIAFFIISLFLIYNAMTPARVAYARRRKN